MLIVNPNYTNAAPAGVTAARWTAILNAATAYLANHTEIYVIRDSDVAKLQPELADPWILLQLCKALNLTVIQDSRLY